jgi:hypothetical protein
MPMRRSVQESFTVSFFALTSTPSSTGIVVRAASALVTVPTAEDSCELSHTIFMRVPPCRGS